MRTESGAQLCVVCELAGGCGDFWVELYDSENTRLERRRAKAGHPVSFCVEECGEYRVRAAACAGVQESSPAAASAWITLTPGGRYSRRFLFRSACPPPPPKICVEFHLHDVHYPDLPIEKGVLTLCPSIL